MIMKTNLGEFYYSEYGEGEDYVIVFLSGMGINSAYYDFYNLVRMLPKKKVKLITLDLLGEGLSGYPKREKRNLETISSEINTFVNNISCKKVLFCCHSFSALYILYLLNNRKEFLMNYEIVGFIGIDPTGPSVMKHFMNEFDCLLEEALDVQQKKKQGLTFEIGDDDINPLLPPNEFQKCKVIYSNLMGNKWQIATISKAKQTIMKLLDESVIDIPTLCILSSLNSEDYKKYGNQYFNNNRMSMEITLNSHQYVHWKQLNNVASIIGVFLNQII